MYSFWSEGNTANKSQVYIKPHEVGLDNEQCVELESKQFWFMNYSPFFVVI